MADYEFVTGRLAIGGAIETPENMREIAQAGITHVVNMQREFDDRAILGDTGVEILWLPSIDDLEPKPSELFWDAALFALQALENPASRVLVHCSAGVHRAPMAMLSILRVLGHEPQAAIALIRAVRPQANFPDIYVESVEAFFREYLSTVNSSLEDLENGDSERRDASAFRGSEP